MDRRIAKVARMIAMDGNMMRLPELAHEVNLSGSHLSRLFRENTHSSPIQYRNLLRLQKAEQLLKKSFLSVKQIMAACGYNDRSYFSREFKKQFGLAPSVYRKERIEIRRIVT
jgi:transcriptional regulator GlxA family with amidase domain